MAAACDACMRGAARCQAPRTTACKPNMPLRQPSKAGFCIRLASHRPDIADQCQDQTQSGELTWVETAVITEVQLAVLKLNMREQAIAVEDEAAILEPADPHGNACSPRPVLWASPSLLCTLIAEQSNAFFLLPSQAAQWKPGAYITNDM